MRDLLQAEIVSGGYPDGIMPTEEELRAEFDVPRSCIRWALDALQGEGLVERIRGQGTFVTQRYIRQDIHDMHGVDNPAPDSIWAGRMRAELIDWRDVPAPPPVARMLAIEEGETVLRIDYVAYIENLAIGGATNYLVYPEAGNVAPSMFIDDFYSMLRRAGVRLDESTFRIDVAPADTYDAELFGLRVGDPVVVMDLSYSIQGRPVDVAFARSCGSRMTFFSRATRG